MGRTLHKSIVGPPVIDPLVPREVSSLGEKEKVVYSNHGTRHTPSWGKEMEEEYGLDSPFQGESPEFGLLEKHSLHSMVRVGPANDKVHGRGKQLPPDALALRRYEYGVPLGRSGGQCPR